MHRGLWILFLVAICIFVSAYAIETQTREVWFDEAFSVQTALALEQGKQIDFSQYDVHPPLYYHALAAWIPLGYEWVDWGRWLSALFFCIFVVFVFLGLEPLYGRNAAGATAATITLLSTYIHYGTEMRPYMMVLALSAMIFWAVVRFNKNHNFFNYAVALVGVATLPFIHYLAAMATPFFALFSVVLNKKNWKFATLLFVSGSIGALFAFWKFALPQVLRSEGMWFQHSTLSSWMSSVAYSFYAPQGSLFGDFYGTFFTLFQGIAFVGLGLALYLIFKKERTLSDRATIAMILTSLFPFLGLLAGSLLSIVLGPGFGNVFHHRLFLVVTWMFAAGLLGYVFKWIMSEGKQIRKTILLIAIVCSAVWLFFGPYEDSLHYELERTIAHIPNDDLIVVHESPFSGAPAIIYGHYMGWNHRHTVMSDLTPAQGNTAGYDAWNPNNIYWNLSLPEDKEFYYIRSESENGGIATIPEEWQTVIYDDDGIRLMKVTQP